jgi:3-phenylpropionate/cinnamic acid dioxygenase small subunit
VSSSREAITNLIYTYAERLDQGDFAGVGALFEEASYGAAGGPEVRGAAAVEGILRELVILYENGTPRTQHVTTNLILEIDETAGTASARSYFVVLQGLDEAPIRAVLAGRYRDCFARGTQGWRFTERRLFLDLPGDLSRHLRGNPVTR